MYQDRIIGTAPLREIPCVLLLQAPVSDESPGQEGVGGPKTPLLCQDSTWLTGIDTGRVVGQYPQGAGDVHAGDRYPPLA